MQILQQVLPQRADPQVPHGQHPQGGEEDRGLVLRVLQARDHAEQEQIQLNPKAHEERPSHRVWQ